MNVERPLFCPLLVPWFDWNGRRLQVRRQAHEIFSRKTVFSLNENRQRNKLTFSTNIENTFPSIQRTFRNLISLNTFFPALSLSLCARTDRKTDWFSWITFSVCWCELEHVRVNYFENQKRKSEPKKPKFLNWKFSFQFSIYTFVWLFCVAMRLSIFVSVPIRRW